jgi:hypothetical protein
MPYWYHNDSGIDDSSANDDDFNTPNYYHIYDNYNSLNNHYINNHNINHSGYHFLNCCIAIFVLAHACLLDTLR